MFARPPFARVAGIFFSLLPAVALAAAQPLPKVFYADPQVLAEAKAKFVAKDASLRPAFDRLLAEAADALEVKPLSVMEKNRVPPSGDKHDFVSQAPYFWRDTNAPGEHYIRRDGERNPEAAQDSDAGRLGKVCGSTHALALAFYFTGEERYAAHAAELLRVWFLNPATRMNPNLNFGQGIPGEVDGRPMGIIGSRGFVELVDAINLLQGSPAWSDADQKGMVDWMTHYLDWLRTSRIGIGEGNASNNHGTFYDTQIAAIALFVGNTNVARDVISGAREKRIAAQVEPDGKMPRELQRRTSFGYTLFNLRALSDLATLGRNVGVDLWHYETKDGRSIRRALEFVAPFADPAQKWPYEQIHEANRFGIATLLLRAAPEYPDAKFSPALKFFKADELAASQERLTFRTANLSDAARPAPSKRANQSAAGTDAK